MTTCTACGRLLTRSPVMLGGMPYGPVCGAKAGDPLEADLFTSPDIERATIRAHRRLRRTINVSAARHIREMRAAWRAVA